ncbi:class I SAM-dependent methyltransferase [Micromonospora sp. LOL_024]|uniref:class I SAM-dependent methyltransferase n=1 Tax=Micromonospora sp. LOL_024 TaxID=3345412 RepID=UPI003A89400E
MTETAPTVSLPGGEMLAWSDRRDGATDRPLAALAARLVPAGARVLVAGPHDPVLLDALAHARLTCLLRGYPDAEAVAGRVERVLVAGPHGLPTGEEYDVVIAGAGLDAVESVEGERLGWDGLLARLVAALRPGGDLLLRVDNPLGVHRLVSASSWYAGRSDTEWTVGGVLDTSRPTNLEQAHARLAVAGARIGSCYAAYPRPDLTTALLSADVLSRRTDSGLFDAVLHEACTEGFTGQFVLADPARLAVDALHAGRATELAPSWLLHARRATGEPASADSGEPDDAQPEVGGPNGLPVLLRAAAADTVVEVLDGPDGWRWHRADSGSGGPAPTPSDSRQAAHRDPQAPQGPVPDGRLLRSLLLDGCLRRDTALLRRLLHGYAEWLDGEAERGQLAGAVALAGADNLVVVGDRFAVLDPSWRADAPMPVDVVLARTLWRFATELLTGGCAHPWISTLDAAGLTVVLGGVAGRDFDRAVVGAAVQAEAVVGAVVHGPQQSAGRVDPGTGTVPPAGPRSYQQLYETWLREREENTRLAALLEWTEELLDARERALRRTEAKINLLSGSLSYKVGRLAITPARMAKRGAGAAKRRARAAIAAKRQEQTKREQK